MNLLQEPAGQATRHLGKCHCISNNINKVRQNNVLAFMNFANKTNKARTHPFHNVHDENGWSLGWVTRRGATAAVAGMIHITKIKYNNYKAKVATR